ncbi:MAG: GNAT family N-acetyltransferase [Alphaproteobacteria bacterium]|nr:GNAT family N-acetyltransferase [Alphaproteobacteria bacterium]
MDAPRLETPRLILRAHQPNDLDACAAMWADAGVARAIGAAPSTRAQTWRRMLSYVGLWRMCGHGYWAVEDRETGLFLGDIGLADFKRGLGPDFDGAPEMGWALAPAAHGRGVATEAGKACLAWVGAQPAMRRTVCLIATNNRASLGVAAKLGFQRFAATTIDDEPALLFERTR